MSPNRWIDKEDVVHIYNGLLLRHKKERNWVSCSEVDGPWVCHTEWSKSEREKQIPYANAYIWNLKKKWFCTSLVAQWLRIRLPLQETRVRALVREDPTCRGPTKPMLHNYWACALEPMSHSYWAHVPQLLKPTCLEPVLRNKSSHTNEKPAHCNEQ